MIATQRSVCLAIAVWLFAMPAFARTDEEAAETFKGASAGMQTRLDESVKELEQLQARIADEKLPLSRKLNELEAELSALRAEHNEASSKLESQELALSNLRKTVLHEEDIVSYLSGLLDDYRRKFEVMIHISEMQRYEQTLEAARRAPENATLEQEEVFRLQAEVMKTGAARLLEAVGGTRFAGKAIDDEGTQRDGQFLVLGPTVLFRSHDASKVGTIEQRNSFEPSTVLFADPKDTAAASEAIASATGVFPFDPTLGNAHLIESTKEGFIEHVKKGGPVMVPIFGMAALALLVALYKWLSMAFIRRPSRKRVNDLLDAVEKDDPRALNESLDRIKGPAGEMLAVGVEHRQEPRELVEEVMYEQVLTTRLRLEKLLPFIAICAASAPLLGLLGTVTGIINTFKLITVFGSGDVKSLSGGISEALITTKFGLIVAIPSLLLHAFLSRKARGIVSQMEQSALAFANQIDRSSQRAGRDSSRTAGSPRVDDAVLREQVEEILADLARKRSDSAANFSFKKGPAGGQPSVADSEPAYVESRSNPS